jgi:hypothetical protein
VKRILDTFVRTADGQADVKQRPVPVGWKKVNGERNGNHRKNNNDKQRNSN